MGSIFSLVPDKEKAWSDLHFLIQDKDANVRRGAAFAIGAAFSLIPDKNQAWQDLIRLAQDKDERVRLYATSAIEAAADEFENSVKVRMALSSFMSEISKEDLYNLIRQFLEFAGFEIQILDKTCSFICQPIEHVWKNRIKSDVYSTIRTGRPLDRLSVLNAHEDLKRTRSDISHAFVFVDQKVEDDAWLEIAALRANKINIMPIPLTILDENRLAGNALSEGSILANYLERFFGKGFDPYYARTPISDVLNFLAERPSPMR